MGYDLAYIALNGRVMFCYKCGNGLKDDDVYCPKCGTKAHTDMQSGKEDKKDEDGALYKIVGAIIVVGVVLLILYAIFIALPWILIIGGVVLTVLVVGALANSKKEGS